MFQKLKKVFFGGDESGAYKFVADDKPTAPQKKPAATPARKELSDLRQFKANKQAADDLTAQRELSELRQFKEQALLDHQLPLVKTLLPAMTRSQFSALSYEGRNLLSDIAQKTEARCAEIVAEIAQAKQQHPLNLASTKTAADNLINELQMMSDTSKLID